MWSLRQKEDGSFFLTFDRYRRYSYNLRGTWEWIGPQGNEYTAYAKRVNENLGYLCANDDEGSVRILVLED